MRDYRQRQRDQVGNEKLLFLQIIREVASEVSKGTKPATIKKSLGLTNIELKEILKLVKDLRS